MQDDSHQARGQTDAWDLQALEMRKSYGKVNALDGATLRARYGEVHALLGENGAGKSTMCKIVTGSVRPDAGELLLDGRAISNGSVGEAMRHGIGTVFQELSLLPDLSVAENMFIGGGEPRGRTKLVDRRAARRRTDEIFDELGIEGIDPRSAAGSLPLAQQQLVEIAKVIARKPRILILDEATSTLPRQDVLWLFGIVRRLRDEGAAVFLISHRLREAFELADRITVFRNGADAKTGTTDEFTEATLVEAMLGRELGVETERRPAPAAAEVRLEVRELNVKNRVRDVSFELRRGEILGLAGLQGQGQTAVLQALYGWTRHDGEVLLDGQPIDVRTPRRAIRSGVALVPEDRRTQGLALEMSIRDNLTLPTLRRQLGFGNLISPAREERFAEHLAKSLNVKAGSLEDDVASLSGGNQQKVLLGKVLSLEAKVLLFADITRGVDVGTKADIFALMRELTADGTSIVFYSSDSMELIHMCHRVAVMFDHTIACVLEGDEITERNIVQASVSGRIATSEEVKV
ncbi:MAG: transporter ATP-binding protein [Conexibacter sp.]|jgi:ribose transport system ATP-binding protein|nr:transporter ATP-binding protein [Conexibacter sp.]